MEARRVMSVAGWHLRLVGGIIGAQVGFAFAALVGLTLRSSLDPTAVLALLVGLVVGVVGCLSIRSATCDYKSRGKG